MQEVLCMNLTPSKSTRCACDSGYKDNMQPQRRKRPQLWQPASKPSRGPVRKRRTQAFKANSKARIG